MQVPEDFMRPFLVDYSQGYVACWDYNHPLRSDRPGGVWATIINVANHESTACCVNYSRGRNLERDCLEAQWREWADQRAADGEGHRLWRLAVVRLMEDCPDGFLMGEDLPLTDEQWAFLQKIKDHDDAREILAKEGLL